MQYKDNSRNNKNLTDVAIFNYGTGGLRRPLLHTVRLCLLINTDRHPCSSYTRFLRLRRPPVIAMLPLPPRPPPPNKVGKRSCNAKLPASAAIVVGIIIRVLL